MLNSSTNGSAMRSRNVSPVRTTFDTPTPTADRWLSSSSTTSSLLSSNDSSKPSNKSAYNDYLSLSDRPPTRNSNYDTPTPTSSGSIGVDRWSSNTRNLAGLPPVYDSSYSRLRTREPSTDITNIQLRNNRRDTSQERSIRPSASSSLLKYRRSSFVETPSSSLSKYF
jgi:hypothetical protein